MNRVLKRNVVALAIFLSLLLRLDSFSYPDGQATISSGGLWPRHMRAKQTPSVRPRAPRGTDVVGMEYPVLGIQITGDLGYTVTNAFAMIR